MQFTVYWKHLSATAEYNETSDSRNNRSCVSKHSELRDEGKSRERFRVMKFGNETKMIFFVLISSNENHTELRVSDSLLQFFSIANKRLPILQLLFLNS